MLLCEPPLAASNPCHPLAWRLLTPVCVCLHVVSPLSVFMPKFSSSYKDTSLWIEPTLIQYNFV